jgi:hypothetical protein
MNLSDKIASMGAIFDNQIETPLNVECGDIGSISLDGWLAKRQGIVSYLTEEVTKQLKADPNKLYGTIVRADWEPGKIFRWRIVGLERTKYITLYLSCGVEKKQSWWKNTSWFWARLTA